MTRILFSGLIFSILLTSGCQKCQQCTYSYTRIDIISTPNGEVEEETTVSGNLEDGDFTTSAEQECIKGREDFTLKAKYELEKSTSEEQDFEFICTET